MPVVPRVLVQAGRIDLAAEIGIVERQGGVGAVGGIVSFSGYCRDEGGRLRALELEHYPGMATRELTRIAAEASDRWPLLACTALHRFGMIVPGEEIVFVACASAHRDAAFAGANFLMDYLKMRAPFWKREHLADGSTGPWIEAKTSDTDAADRWTAQAKN